MALESMIHLQTILECVLCCVANANFSSFFVFLTFFIFLLLYSKIAQYGPTCHNGIMSLCFAAKVNCLLCFDATSWPFFRLAPPFSCIKCVATYSILNFFICIISKALMKYLYNTGKLLSKVITMPSSYTGTSKHAS